ncbi:MAG: SDR family NAD(P)-dependent oxidoreductase [Thermodesulfobacteriota bacterium]
MADRFAGKVVVVTGASSGIGSAAARQFAAEGASVALVARGAQTLEWVAGEIRGTGGVARAYPADVRDRTACESLLRSVAEAFGGIDVLVNNAGANHRGPLESQRPEDLAQIIEVNLIAPIVLTRLALPYLHRRERAAIVNVASIAGQIPVAHEATYSASKSGLRAFTFALREELEGSGITVSAVSPGPVDTGFLMEDLEHVPDLVFANPMSTCAEVAKLIVDCAEDGVAERTIPALTGYMARVGSAVPALKRVLAPILEERGRVVKEQYRARQQASGR